MPKTLPSSTAEIKSMKILSPSHKYCADLSQKLKEVRAFITNNTANTGRQREGGGVVNIRASVITRTLHTFSKDRNKLH
ncbi:hypothetical protein C1H46_033390 [Malus baccata]|uniref:Uncharacterized protein n=1 Tax=Malus baccata TaxID=106549 RepID=A0A540L3M2_MALBA|nr:hypothetical protein C1H46_033390 [Malus baccata]